MKIRTTIFLSVFLLVQPIKSFGWGPDGHKNIGALAYQYLEQRTKDSVQFYLGSVSLADAGLWMDEMRADHSYDYMKPWHYIAIGKGESYRPNENENVINELNRRIEHLKHRNLYSKDQNHKGLFLNQYRIFLYIFGF